MIQLVSIVIPTLRREKSLERALRSALDQRLPENIAIEVVVVDNSPEASARYVVTRLCENDSRLRYFSEPVPGVATARNAGVRAATGSLIAFLDDDEEAGPGWIAALVSSMRATGAQAAFGPVEARADRPVGPAAADGIGAFRPYFSRDIKRLDHSDITDLAANLGTNNSIFERASCLIGPQPFDESLNEIGGEDSLLLSRLVQSGRRFAFAAQAGVIEWAPERRLTWAYVRKRKFLSGQIRVFVHQMAGPPRWDRIALWMGIGAVQFAVAGAFGMLLRPFDRNRSEKALATAWGGLGKVLWAPRFRPALYGSGLVS